MEQELLQLIGIFIGGLICGLIIMLIFNKLGSGSASPAGLKQEYDDYQEKVESHFEETSKKFQDMTQQYQDLYKHLSVGATTLCRPDSVAATLADQSADSVRIESQTLTEEEQAAKIKEEQARAAKAKVDKALAEESKVNEQSDELANEAASEKVADPELANDAQKSEPEKTA